MHNWKFDQCSEKCQANTKTSHVKHMKRNPAISMSSLTHLVCLLWHSTYCFASWKVVWLSSLSLSLFLSRYHLMKACIRKQNLHLPESYLISWIRASERTLRIGSAGSFAVVMPCRGTGVSPTRALEKRRDLFMLSNWFYRCLLTLCFPFLSKYDISHPAFQISSPLESTLYNGLKEPLVNHE